MLDASWGSVRSAFAREQLGASVPRGRSPPPRGHDAHLVELCDRPHAACHGWLGYDGSGVRLRRGDHLLRRATGGRWHHGIFYGGTHVQEVMNDSFMFVNLLRRNPRARGDE